MKLTQILREIVKNNGSLPFVPNRLEVHKDWPAIYDQARKNREAAAAQRDAIEQRENKYKELTQAIQRKTGLFVSSGKDAGGNDEIRFDGEMERWGSENGSALKAKILPILQKKFGKDAEFIFNNYLEREPNKEERKASITLPKT
jgi:hypothetical protein